MSKLCFGTFATVLTRCKASSITQKRLCGTILFSVDPERNLCDDDNATSDLVNGKKNLSDYATEGARTANGRTVANYFKSSVLPLLDGNKKSIIVLALKNIIAEDDSIEPDVTVELINGSTKRSLNNQTLFVFEEFLAGVFLYTAVYVANRGNRESVQKIDNDLFSSLEPQKWRITFSQSYVKPLTVTENKPVIDPHMLALLTLTKSSCQRCSKPLGIERDGRDVNYAEIFHLDETEDTVLCVDCNREMLDASEEEILALLSAKHELVNHITARDAISHHDLEKQIEEVLREIDHVDVSDATKLKTSPIKVEKKVSDKRLKGKIIDDVTQLYEAVNNALDRLSGESKLNVDKFAKSIRSMFEDANANLSTQSEVYNLLVDTLCDKYGRNYREACTVIISYFVQRCEVFDEITE